MGWELTVPSRTLSGGGRSVGSWGVALAANRRGMVRLPGAVMD